MRFINDAQRRAVFANTSGRKYTPADFTHYLRLKRPTVLPRVLTQTEVDELNSNVDECDYAFRYGVIPDEYARKFKLLGVNEDE